MAEITLQGQALKAFTYQNEDEVLGKLDKFAEDGIGQIHLVIDFDRTLTVGRNAQNEDITTWQILKEHLPQAALNRYYRLFNTYRPLEIEGRLSLEDAVAWWEQVLKLFVEHRINLVDVEGDFLTKVSIRPHAKELFDFCEAENVPAVILSAGIKDVIDLWAKTYQVKPPLVLSTRLVVNSAGDILGWEENSLIHTLNKKEMGHSELMKLRQQRPNIILIGDSMEDADMVDGNENVLRIRINDPRPDEKEDKTNFHIKTFERYDLMIESGTFAPVLRVLELLNQSSTGL